MVFGTFNVSDIKFKQTLSILKIYKGTIAEKEIELSIGGLDCMDCLSFEDGAQLIMGLQRTNYESELEVFVAFGCYTSGVIIKGNKAFAPKDQCYMLKKPKIGILKRRMSLKRLEKIIKRKLWLKPIVVICN